MVKCANPYCDNLTRYKKYCSSTCKSFVEDVNRRKLSFVDDFDKLRKGFILLPNGVEIRNDAMGKHIAGNYSSSQRATYK